MLVLMIMPVIAVLSGCHRGNYESSGLELLALEPASARSIAAESIYPLTPGTFTLIQDDGAGDRSEITSVGSATRAFGAAIEWAIPGRAEYLARGSGGAIIMPASIEYDEHALTRFDPPLTVAPPELRPGEPFTAESHMVVLDEQNHLRQRESGTARRTITYMDDQQIRTPMGTFTARRVVAEFHADLTFADATEITTYWIVPELGVVASEAVNTLKILGMKASGSTVRYVRAN